MTPSFKVIFCTIILPIIVAIVTNIHYKSIFMHTGDERWVCTCTKGPQDGIAIKQIVPGWFKYSVRWFEVVTQTSS